MFGRFLVYSLLIVTMYGMLCPHVSHAYGVETHYKLTENAVREYKRLGGSLEITDGDLAAMAGGAVHEDEMRTYNLSSAAKLFGQDIDIDHARPANHFFDPIHQLPLTKLGKQLGSTSPQWAVDTKAQANFGVYSKLGQEDKLFSADGDYSWERNVYEYVHGDRRRALSGLGHTLHLLEDATSPAHTRNDAHSGSWMDGGDPYEYYTGTLTPHVTVTPTAVPYFSEPDVAISSTAYYTNTNYFSKDTIYDFELPNKNILPKVSVSTLDYLANSDGAKVLFVETKFDPQTGKLVNLFHYLPQDIVILSSNWLALSQKSVTNSVGLIRLFERDVEEEKKTGALAKKNVSTVEALALHDARVLAAGLGITNTLVPTQLASVSKSLTMVTPQPLPEAPDLDLAYYAPSDETLAAMASAFASANAPLAASTTPPTQPLLVSPTILPEQTAYTPNQVNNEQLVVNSGAAAPALSTQTTTFGGLTSLTFGAGVGGGSAEPRAESLDPRENQVQDQTQTNNTTPPTKETSVAAGQGSGGGGGGSTNTTPTCTLPQVLDVATNTCKTPAPTCTADETLDPTTSTCLTPPPAAPTLLPDTFTENTTLSGAYTSAEGQTITIPEGITVTLAAGTTLTLAHNTLLVVAGTLDLEGTESAPVAITTADTTTPTYWRGITVTSTGTLSAAHATLSYGGYVPAGSTDTTLPRATIHTSGTTTLTDVSITHSASTAVVHDGPTLTTTNLTVEDSLAAVEAFTPYTLTHTTIHRSGADTWVITLHTLLGTITGTVGEGNGFNAIALEPFASLLPGATAHLYPNDISYVMVGDPTISGSLYLHPGLFVQNMPSTRWRITRSGSIFVPNEPGTAPILTSLYDNATYGEARGTAHAYGNLPDHAPTVGDWFGLFVQNADESFVDPRVGVKYGL